MAKTKAGASVETAIHKVEKEAKESGCWGCHHKPSSMGSHAGGGAVYGMGLIGALVFYIQHASSFTDGLLGILKALIWPAMVIYQVLTTLKM